MPRAAFLSTSHTGTGMGGEGGSAKLSKDVYIPIGVVVVVSAVVGSAVGYAVNRIDQKEITRIGGSVASKIARVEDERRLSEDHLKEEVERSKKYLTLASPED